MKPGGTTLLRAAALATALTAFAWLTSCSVDYADILGGKSCDPAGSCAPDYLCDPASWKCVPAGELKGTDGGIHFDAGSGGHVDAGSHPDAGRPDAGPGDTGHPADSGADAGVDAGPGDTGAPDAEVPDAGADAGIADAGPADAGGQVCTPDEYRCTDDKNIERCRPDGSGWDAQPACAVKCIVNQCVKCVPNSVWCEAGTTLKTCAADGMGDSPTACDKGCNDTASACYVCNTLDMNCKDESTAAACSSDRMGWDFTDCCVPSSCALGLCTKTTTPYIASISPDNANVGVDVTVVFTGCQFSTLYNMKAIVQMKSGSQWSEPSNGSITSQTATEIQYLLKNIAGPGNVNYELRVENPYKPYASDSNSVVFHVN